VGAIEWEMVADYMTMPSTSLVTVSLLLLVTYSVVIILNKQLVMKCMLLSAIHISIDNLL
jgi:hypothetical protein